MSIFNLRWSSLKLLHESRQHAILNHKDKLNVLIVTGRPGSYIHLGTESSNGF